MTMRRLREERGLTLAALSGQAQVSVPALSNFERGEVPGVHRATRIAHALGVEPGDIWPRFAVKAPEQAKEVRS